MLPRKSSSPRSDFENDEGVVDQLDCGTTKAYAVRTLRDEKNDSIIENLFERIDGRYTARDVVDPKTGEVIVEENTYLTSDLAQKIVDAGVEEVKIRNVFTCEAPNGICAKCYGRNMATGNPVEPGEAIGVMAAQAIGEPGTQLTMRNFHTGGVANKSGDITQGLPRVEELFEARNPKRVAVISKVDGQVTDISGDTENGTMVITVANENDAIQHKCDRTQPKLSSIEVGTVVKAGEPLTEGVIAPKELLEVAGVRAVQEYILKEVKKVYSAQSIDISDKHLEVMIRQMLRRVMVVEPGDSELSVGQTLSMANMVSINNALLDEDKEPAKYQPILLGISKAAVETDSFLSAASFQETTRVLTDAAVRGKTDSLQGLKENVILGSLIPAGTGRTDCSRETTDRIVMKANRLRELREERARQLEELNAAKQPDESSRRDQDEADDYQPKTAPLTEAAEHALSEE